MRASRLDNNGQTAGIELRRAKRRRGRSKATGSGLRQSALESRALLERHQQQEHQQQQQQHEQQQCNRLAEPMTATCLRASDIPRGNSSGQSPVDGRIGVAGQAAISQIDHTDEESQDDNQDQRQQAKRPLIKSQQDLPRSSAAGSAPPPPRASSMVQMEPAGVQMAASVELASSETAGRKLSQGSSAGHTSSSSMLESSRRSSSEYAPLDMAASLIKCDSSLAGQHAPTSHARRQRAHGRVSSLGDLLAAPAGSPKGRFEQAASQCGSCDDLRPLGAHSRRTEHAISQSMLERDPSVGQNEKFQLYWRRLTFSYEPSWPGRLARGARGSRLKVLDELSGSIRSNQLVAIIGPSGCGKTTLLQFLAGNNGRQRERIRIRGIAEPKVAFIGQHDSLLPGLTARETLMYASRLQCNAPNFDHAAHIRPILSELGLCECADRNVCKLSGGQAKRVTIAQELLYPTNLLVLDEVTSGLDASSSYSIVRLLKYLVSDSSYPMSIVMSIHQPSARLFSVFDKVYVMSEGRCLYEGGCNLDQINEHLGRFQLECPKFHNIADYLIELASSSGPDELALEANGAGWRGAAEKASWAQSETGAVKERMVEFQRKQSAYQIELEAEALLEERALGQAASASNGQQRARSRPPDQQFGWRPDGALYEAIDGARARRQRPFWAHLGIHFRRSLLRIRRSYILTWLQLLTYIVLGLQLASFYGPDIGKLSGCPRLPANLMHYILAPAGPDEADEHDELTLELRRIQENMNFLLVAVLTATFAALEITVITFPLEAKTIKREWSNGWYRVSSYFMGRTLADLPFQVLFVLAFCLLIYAMTGQIEPDSWRLGSFVLCVLMTAFVAQSFGFMFGAIFMDNLPAAVFAAPLAIFPTLLFSGFFARVSQVPYYWRPLTYVSHFRYSFDALLVTLYGYNRCNCDQEQLSNYHASLANQTSSMREMFHLLFGAADCLNSAGSAAEPDELAAAAAAAAAPTSSAPGSSAQASDVVSREDMAAIMASNSTLGAQLMSMIGKDGAGSAAATASSVSRSVVPAVGSGLGAGMKQLEDLLVESVFQQMSSTPTGEPSAESSTPAAANDTNTGAPGAEMSAIDRMAHRFSTRLTGMLNKQSNFGHPMPTECAKFNSYLITEFSLTDDDLWFGLLMLLLAVLLTRVLCSFILHFTIASRAK